MQNKSDENAAVQREFFNGLAPTWRKDEKSDKEFIASLLAPVQLKRGDRVLDIACGTGVLDEYLLSMGLAVDGIDVAENMIDRARKNIANRGANYIVGDFYAYSSRPYDCLLAFDCYPHFKDKLLFERQAYSLLKPQGTLWIMFDASKQAINARHAKRGAAISVGLESAEKEKQVFLKRFDLIYLEDNDERYVLGFKKNIEK